MGATPVDSALGAERGEPFTTDVRPSVPAGMRSAATQQGFTGSVPTGAVAASTSDLSAAPFGSLAAATAQTPFANPPAAGATTRTAGHSAPSAPGAPGGAGTGSSSAFGGTGGGSFGGFGAVLLSFFVLALCASSRLLLTPAVWRPVAFISLLERPG
jgi:hypothetical protein